jgi:hypothetical protein
MPIQAATVEDYLAQLPAERSAVLQALRGVIKANLDSGFEEGMQYGMIGYYVPHRVFAAGYHCDPRQPLPFAALAAQKNHYSLYLYSLYACEPNAISAAGDQSRWFRQAWTADGRKLDMGKGCVRFKKLADVPLDVLAEAFARIKASAFVENYQRERGLVTDC